jgi:hypothetical protein
VIYLYFRQGQVKFSVLSDSLLTPAISGEGADCRSLRYCADHNAPEYAAGMLGEEIRLHGSLMDYDSIREEVNLALERIGWQMGIGLALDYKPLVGRFINK